jgi:hypothetical protein
LQKRETNSQTFEKAVDAAQPSPDLAVALDEMYEIESKELNPEALLLQSSDNQMIRKALDASGCSWLLQITNTRRFEVELSKST